MNAGCVTLAGETLIHLHGADIPGFLQGQLTCDLRKLGPGRAVAGAMCNVQGRVISDLWVVHVDDRHCILRLRRSLAEAFASNLSRYARFSRIEVAVDPRDDAVVGAYGEISGGARSLPEAVGDCVADGDTLCLRTAAGLVEWISADPRAAAGPGIPAGCAAGSPEHWDAAQLLAGHYALEEDDSQEFTPQALNYDRSGRVAFDKGCYTGQEVVARLHYRGQSKKRLLVAVCAGRDLPLRGTALLTESGDAVGEILRSVHDMHGRAVIAAMIRADHADQPLFTADGRDVAPQV